MFIDVGGGGGGGGGWSEKLCTLNIGGGKGYCGMIGLFCFWGGNFEVFWGIICFEL